MIRGEDFLFWNFNNFTIKEKENVCVCAAATIFFFGIGINRVAALYISNIFPFLIILHNFIPKSVLKIIIRTDVWMVGE